MPPAVNVASMVGHATIREPVLGKDLYRASTTRGADASFRATGQAGILIAGGGIGMDAIVADFLAGAAETLSPDADAAHWDVIEGQGSLFHPAYAVVTLGLLDGSQPDAIVLCHAPERTTIEEYPDYPIPPLAEAIDAYVRAGQLTNRAIRCGGAARPMMRLETTIEHWELVEPFATARDCISHFP